LTVAAEQTQKTQFGLPIDYSFAKAASEERIQRASAALKAHGFTVEIVDTPAQALGLVTTLLPKGRSILTASSETLRLSGLEEEINNSGKYDAIRPKLEKLDRNTQRAEMRKLSATPDVVIGSVAAVTEDGRLLAASASGSQIGPYAVGAEKAIFVVGSQKLVPDLDSALRRIQLYAYPKEDIRARERYGRPSAVMKTLIISGDFPPGRSTVVLVREPIGF
jgi:hypothetical protein